MEKKTLKLTAVAAGAVVLAGAAFASPSFASAKHTSFKAAASSSTGTTGATPTWGGASGDATDGKFKQGPKAKGAQSSIAATISGVPATVTDLEVAEHSALFIAYEYTGTAPTTQPTTGGHPARFEATALANGTVTGTLGFMSPKTAGTYMVAVYNSKTDASPVLVTIVVDAAGKATATASAALTSAYDATIKAPAFGGPAGGPGFGPKDGKGPRGGHGHGPRGDKDGDKGGSGWTAPTTGTTPAPTTTTAPTV
jgi:hypothetical protein